MSKLTFATPLQLDQLTQEFYILHLVYHRGHNQHRVQKWWKLLNILHRKIRKIIKLLIDMEKETVATKFEKKREQVIEVIRYLVKKQVLTKAYYEFNGIIALGQYINIGFTLVGLLSKVYAIFMEIEGVQSALSLRRITVQDTLDATKVDKRSESRTPTISIHEDDDLGEIVQPSEIEVKRNIEIDFGLAPTSKRRKLQEVSKEEAPPKLEGQNLETFKKEIASDKPLKSKANTMDDIFGKPKKAKKLKKKPKKKNDIDDIFG